MKIYTDISGLQLSNPVLTTGTFDGIHRGHFSVLSHMKEKAALMGGESVVFTFWPHPRYVLQNSSGNLKLLNTLEEKKTLFERSGIDNLIIYPFTEDFASLSSRDFIQKILVEKIGVKHLVFGYDHQFGKNREGSFDSLKESSHEFGFSVEQVDALTIDGINISSTKIRHMLEAGEIDLANKYLGYNYYMRGVVVSGMKLGRKIGFPTANVSPDDDHKLIPPPGVYCVKVRVGNEEFAGMMNIGFRPTFGENNRETIEVHIIDFDREIYDNAIELWFVTKLRDEKKFDGIDALITQLKKDKEETIRIMSK
ncbi:MAG: riboflavin biosynthesis protein RibF [Bacteroidetes bacterium GWF2_38_335]|nr:MAG: riboflavin biosynthesis protein RibF [Bacteroidetes bacterium GWF2_38_335]OFY80846.1 MAG: riboflavin biosynthesis protein RibF [Bacteroidetes bacterium RIFOXYA12_FULL_38_20]